MIPKVMPPLSGLSVLVTRPLPQATVLAQKIALLGGESVLLPAIDIKRLEIVGTSHGGSHDLVVFVSVNAVEHGARLIDANTTTLIAAIGRATAAALTAAGLPPNVVPEAGFNSEALLAHPQLKFDANSRVLIVRGRGGRELLQETFSSLGCHVETLDVYERTTPALDEQRRSEIEAVWSAHGVDIVTATSVETLDSLLALLSEQGRALLAVTPLVVASRRIMQAAIDRGLRGEILVAAGADDDSILGAISQWHSRARS
ncbi:MAG TPA: uroporphyrinogen-III synthase [Steroidobacteraceae bacterium]|jgi:uroporphyrinogen-III synthase